MWHAHACGVCGPMHTAIVSLSWPCASQLVPVFFAIPKPNEGDDVAVTAKAGFTVTTDTVNNSCSTSFNIVQRCLSDFNRLCGTV